MHLYRIILVFPFLSYLFLAAHELRVGNLWFMGGWLLLAVVLLTFRRPWVRHLSIITLMLGLFLWLKVTVQLLQFRLAVHEPYTLLLAIMGGVAALMAGSIALLLSSAMRDWFTCKK